MENRSRRTPQQTVFHDGFMYYTSKRCNGTRYLRCTKYRQTRCQASGKIEESGVFMLTNGQHNHENLEDQIQGRNFKSRLRDACTREKGNLKNIYERLATNNREGALVVPFKKVYSSMQRWRQSTRRKSPKNLEDLARVLAAGEQPIANAVGVYFIQVW